MLSHEPIVCLSITPWETHLPSSGHYLMREFARANRVLFVDRPLSMKDLWTHRQNPEMAERMARTLRSENPLRSWGIPGLDGWVLTPPATLPINGLDSGIFYDSGFVANAQLLRHSVRWAMERLEMRDPILWISFELPMGAGLIGTLGECLSAYHCFDEVLGEPYLARHGQELEGILFERADVVFASSRKLAHDRSPLRPDILYVPNGVDFPTYHRATDAKLAIPDELRAIPSPRIGYLGNLEARVDYALIEQIALARPEWSIVLVGPSEGYWQEKLAILGQLANVYVLGKRPPEQAPAILKAFDAAIIPFVRSPQTEAIYPLKLNEYLAAGKSVVMTPFADLREFQSVAWIAPDAAAFIAALEAALRPVDGATLQRRWQLAKENDWRDRAQAIAQVLAQRLSARPPRRGLEGRRNLA
ncbi:putative teichuronic acid biosynthesis glycosyltransferase TuaH [compost metagenome]